MSLDVGLHLLLVLERLIANGALVALGPIMLDTMQLQHMIVAKVTEANVTMIRLLTGVRSGVDLQLFGACESLATSRLRAFVRLLARMRAHVYHQLAGLYKRLLADGTLVRTLARMDPHVAMQLPRMLERSSAHIALVGSLLRVDASMHLQILLHTEQLVAELALERTLSSVRPVVADLQGTTK